MLGKRNIYCSTGEYAKTYSEYLSTKHWKNLRLKIYERSNGLCEKCGDWLDGKFEVHHKTYIRIGNERYGDLLCLCHNCHTELHRAKQLQRNKKKKQTQTKSCPRCHYILHEVGNMYMCDKCNYWQNIPPPRIKKKSPKKKHSKRGNGKVITYENASKTILATRQYR